MAQDVEVVEPQSVIGGRFNLVFHLITADRGIAQRAWPAIAAAAPGPIVVRARQTALLNALARENLQRLRS
jgi:hypothetical protein